MKFKEIVNRISGLSISVFGIQWIPRDLEITKARRVISFLEDKRVLYTPGSMEDVQHCVESVIKIREFLTTELGNIDSNSELAKNLRAMRAACRKFLQEISENDDRKIIAYARDYGHWASWKFYGDLGIMRGIFGLHIALIASAYGLDVEDELASILPNIDEYIQNEVVQLDIN